MVSAEGGPRSDLDQRRFPDLLPPPPIAFFDHHPLDATRSVPAPGGHRRPCAPLQVRIRSPRVPHHHLRKFALLAVLEAHFAGAKGQAEGEFQITKWTRDQRSKTDDDPLNSLLGQPWRAFTHQCIVLLGPGRVAVAPMETPGDQMGPPGAKLVTFRQKRTQCILTG